MAILKVSRFMILAAWMMGLTAADLTAGASPGHAGDSHGNAYLGVTVDNVSPEQAAALHLNNGGASIASVDQDGPASRAGLKGGDIVVSYNGKAITGSEQFASLIHASSPGTAVTLTVVRSGQNKDIKVTLGDWKQMYGMPKAPLSPVGNMAFPQPPVAPLLPHAYPEMDIMGSTPISARHGIVVESLSPQLSDYFGVPQNKGILVRTVEKGSPGAAAGLKAGDVILQVNDETIHDTADWRRALRGGGKMVLTIVRDKKEMTLQMNLLGDRSELKEDDWDGFGVDAASLALLDGDALQDLNQQVEAAVRSARPEEKKQAAALQKQSEEIRRQAETAAKTLTPEIRKQAEELSKQAVIVGKQTEQMRRDIEQMTPEIARSAREMADSMKPTAKELSDMASQFTKQWQAMQPELQKQMDELKKQLEREERQWQEIFKSHNPEPW